MFSKLHKQVLSFLIRAGIWTRTNASEYFCHTHYTVEFFLTKSNRNINLKGNAEIRTRTCRLRNLGENAVLYDAMRPGGWNNEVKECSGKLKKKTKRPQNWSFSFREKLRRNIQLLKSITIEIAIFLIFIFLSATFRQILPHIIPINCYLILFIISWLIILPDI